MNTVMTSNFNFRALSDLAVVCLLRLRYACGYSGLVGLLLLLLALGYGFASLSLQDQITENKLLLQKLQLSPPPVAEETVPVLTESQQVTNFYQQFPSQDKLSSILQDVHRIADQSGVQLTLGDYKWLKDADPSLVRYEIVFPVEAQYQPLRQFIQQVGLAYPTLGLSEVNIKRESAKLGGAQVKLSYVLMMAKDQAWR